MTWIMIRYCILTFNFAKYLICVFDVTDQCEGNERNPPSPGLGSGKDKKGDDRKHAGGDSSHEEGELPQKNGSRMNNGQGHIKEEETATRGKRADSSRSRYSDIKYCFFVIYLPFTCAIWTTPYILHIFALEFSWFC